METSSHGDFSEKTSTSKAEAMNFCANPTPPVCKGTKHGFARSWLGRGSAVTPSSVFIRGSTWLKLPYLNSTILQRRDLIFVTTKLEHYP